MSSQHLTLAGVGAGPFNLSVAALLSKAPDVKFRFFDRKPSFDWHTGLMLKGARLQTCWMKDLVSPVDPTSPYSFLNFLVQKQRFYAFINAEQSAVSRQEFAQYIKWASEQIPAIEYGSSVREIDFQNGQFCLTFDTRRVMADHLCIGTGTQPYIPGFAKPHLGANVFHGGAMMNVQRDFSGKRVVVVGGGQTGAELFLGLCEAHWGRCASVAWLSRRDNFEPLDETPFTNEVFTPHYVQHFLGLDSTLKKRLLEKQKLSSDGISPSTLRDIYQCLYQHQLVAPSGVDMQLYPDREVTAMQQVGNRYTLIARHGSQSAAEQFEADAVIFCTGFRSVIPNCLQPLMNRLHWQEQSLLTLRDNYQVAWEGEAANRIYAVNASRHHHGIVDPQTSLMAWRGATIVNDLLGYELYNLDQTSMVQWSSGALKSQRNVA